MKKIAVLLVLLISFYLFSMSGDSKDINPEMEKYKITQEEFHNIAINYYKFMYEEEHEWKGMKRKKSEGIIKDYFAIKERDLTVAYVVNYNPDGHIILNAHKNSYPISSHGGGYYTLGEDSVTFKEIQLSDKRIHPIERGGLRTVRDRAINKVKPNPKERELLEKFLVNPDSFKVRFNFDNQVHPQKWWIEKKKVKKVNSSMD